MLEALGAEVRGYSRDRSTYSTLFPPSSVEKRWRTLYGLVEESEVLTRALEKFRPNLVIHLAAQSQVLNSYQNPVDTFYSNAVGTLNIVQSGLTLSSLEGMVVITTDKVYAEGDDIKYESSWLKGSDPYSCSKVAAEQVVEGFRPSYRKLGIPLSVMRGGNIVGGGDWSNFRLVPDVVRANLSGSPLRLRHPNATRPWQHVLDLVFAYCLVAWHSTQSDGATCDTSFNVGPDPAESLSVLQLVTSMGEFGFPVEIELENPTAFEALNLSISSEKISSILGWRPQLDMAATLEKTSLWYRAVLKEGEDPMKVTITQVHDYLKDRP
jgi:CDP-glucose 4,6-dehydratase